MYFLRGELPWQGLKVKSKEDRYKRILEKKKETSSEELCRGYPHEFYQYVEYLSFVLVPQIIHSFLSEKMTFINE